MGRQDDDFGEFALAPNRYGELQEDAFFVIGKSDPMCEPAWFPAAERIPAPRGAVPASDCALISARSWS